MQFSVGDQVVHPQYGPGRVVGVEHRELVEGFEHYYVIELFIDKSTLFMPMCKMDELGVRPVMSQAKLRRVLKSLQEVPRRLSKDFKVRQERIREKLATARPTKVAEAVRDLTGRKRRSHLTKVDRRLLDKGREFLAAEIAAVNGVDLLYGLQTIDRALGDSGGRTAASTRLKTNTDSTGRKKLIRRLLRQLASDSDQATKTSTQIRSRR
jgi:CarD family transcriptional regulator